ncbi:hypothetical protein ASG89_05580 [Paenibacillus sp. Soil766]|nr:hypothetical protein ASG89_05580 [Paenibacillus sp. Soil766]
MKKLQITIPHRDANLPYTHVGSGELSTSGFHTDVLQVFGKAHAGLVPEKTAKLSLAKIGLRC